MWEARSSPALCVLATRSAVLSAPGLRTDCARTRTQQAVGDEEQTDCSGSGTRCNTAKLCARDQVTLGL